jgi:hypothetical protein
MKKISKTKKFFSLLIFCLVLSLGLFLTSCSDKRIIALGLEADNFVISHTEDGPAAKPLKFSPGDVIYIHFLLKDYELDAQGMVWIQEDIVMTDSDGNRVIVEGNIINDRVTPPEGVESIPIKNKITLFDTAVPGDYKIEINVRDKIGGGTVNITTQITVE